jgi:hypothetical protein
LSNSFFKRLKKGSDFETEILKLQRQLTEIQDQISCLQKSVALLFQILPDRLREAIIDGINERNSRSAPF